MKNLFSSSVLAAAALTMSVNSVDAQQLQSLPRPASASQEIVDLGRLLFFDPRLSGDSSTACSDCHDPSFGFGDGAELSRGYPGTKHWRNSQTLVNSAYLKKGLHWDGTVPSLLDQVPGAMGTAFASNIDVPMAEERLRQIPGYVQRFDAIWGESPNINRIAEAIAGYENSLVSADSPYDRFVAGDKDALSDSALRGFGLFFGKANCASCHSGALLTDEDFHNTSVPPNPTFLEDPLVQVTFRFSMRGFGVDPDVYMALDRDPGYYAATKNESDMGKFRTPPLRYLKYTAPYMHNGTFFTLDEVVDFYNKGGTEDVFGTKSSEIKPLRLTDTERNDLVAFLESLSGTEILEDYPELPQYEAITVPGARTTVVASIETGSESDGEVQIIPQSSGVSSEGAGLVIASSSGDISLGDESGVRSILVEPGETLGAIAKREYGDVMRYIDILEANREVISDPDNLLPGTRLRIP